MLAEGFSGKEHNSRGKFFDRRGISFIDYLGARKSKKKQLMEATNITRDSSSLLKAKNSILKMSRPGSQELECLRKCLNQVIVEQVR